MKKIEPPPAKQDVCASCRHGENVKRVIICRRFPPSAQIVPTKEGARVVSPFPEMQPDQWCGEYAPVVAIGRLN